MTILTKYDYERTRVTYVHVQLE